MARRVSGVVLVLAVALLVLAPVVEAAHPDAAAGVWHVVRWGETVSRIARRYGVTVSAIVAANHLANPNRIWPGQRLYIPLGTVPGGGGQQVYIVRWRDTLSSISRHFGVSVWAIVQVNHLANPNRIWPGQRLIIPCSGGLRIDSPAAGSVLNGSVHVSGWGSGAFENTLLVDVRTADGTLLASGSTTISSTEMGGAGPWAIYLSWTRPAYTQPGRIVVMRLSARDGSIIEQASVAVTIQGG